MAKTKPVIENDDVDTEDPEFLAEEAAMLDEAIAEADADPTRYTLEEVMREVRQILGLEK